MKEFSFVSAWTFGVRFFSGRPLAHLAVLAGMGLVLPIAIQFLLADVGLYLSNPVETDVEFTASAPPSAIVLVPLAVGYVLQVGSYFASWRLGFDSRTNLAGSLVFGLLAGLAAVAALGFVVGVLGVGLGQLSPVVGIIVGFIAIFLLMCLLFTVPAVVLATGISLYLGLAMVFGTAVGNVGLAATLVGGSGFVVVVLLILSGIFIWVAGRLSCTIALMIERRSLDLISAAAESWQLTWDDEWRIARYLALVAVVILLLLAAILAGIGAGVASLGLDPQAIGFKIVVLTLVAFLMLLASYVTVLVPAGIHRELRGTTVPTEVFA